MTDTLVVIPARGGSKRLPGKNLAKLAGRSLLAWTAEALAAAGLPGERCLLTTDDPAIAAEGRRLGWLVPWLRPAELATDTATTLDAVLHALDWWRLETGRDPDVTLLMQVTSPFRDPADVRRALDRLEAEPAIDAVISTVDLHRTPATLFLPTPTGLQPLGGAGQGHVLTPNGSFYAIRTATLRRERTFFPARLAAITMDPMRSLDIDTAADLAAAEALASRAHCGTTP